MDMGKLPKIKSASKEKKLAWSWFSKYIRARDCIDTTGGIEQGRCYTCDKLVPFNQLQSGHFQPGRTNNLLFDEDQVHIQCARCNLFLSGNWVAYLKHMRKDYGDKAVDEMMNNKYQVVKYTALDYEELKNKFKHDYEALVESVKFK